MGDRQATQPYYRPLTIFPLALDHELWGADPRGFHRTNVALHLLVCALVFLLARRLGAEVVAAALATLAWGLFPRLTEAVTFVSEVVLADDGFDEVGTISYAGRGSLKFTTIGKGHMGPSAVSGINHGAVLWNIAEGDGEFSGATGLITSNFTFSAEGDVVDNQYVRIYTP